jgi:hypothetical protein
MPWHPALQRSFVGLREIGTRSASASRCTRVGRPQVSSCPSIRAQGSAIIFTCHLFSHILPVGIELVFEFEVYVA